MADSNIMKIANLEYLYDPHVLEDSAKRVFEIDKQNMKLLKTLNYILRTKGKTDCWKDLNVDKNVDQLEIDKRRSIENENRDLYKRLRTSVGMYSTNEMERDWKRNRISSRKKSNTYSSSESTNNISSNKNRKKSSVVHQSAISKNPKIQNYPRCFFELQVSEPSRKLGKIVFQLYNDIVPKTCENFIAFCTSANNLSYENTPIHRIISGYLCQGGDVTKFNGSGGTSIYGDYFNDENFTLKHAAPGILSMWNSGKNTNNSKFNLTFKKLEVLDGKNVVFGKIIRGLSIIHKIESFGTKIGRPTKQIVISKCGLC